LVHASIPLKLGYEQVEMDNEIGNIHLGGSNFMVVEPSALMEVNLHKYLKFDLGIGYRWISQLNCPNLNNSDNSGIVFRSGFRIVLFK
jgi:hypothetical protein